MFRVLDAYLQKKGLWIWCRTEAEAELSVPSASGDLSGNHRNWGSSLVGLPLFFTDSFTSSRADDFS